MTGGARTLTLSSADFERYRAIVRQRAGIEIPEARRGDLEKGICAALTLTGAPDHGALCELLAEGGERGAAAFEAIVPAITINETHFFRNRPQMKALWADILPRLIEARRSTRRLRIWSAGCSTGEEPYSLAILIDRLLPEREDWDVLIRATDIDTTALAKADVGRYGSWSFRDVPAEVKERYFVGSGEHEFELAPRIRRMVSFARLNLIEDRYPSVATLTDRMDLVLCRNVLIYFRAEAIRGVVERLHDSLVEGGWLVVGHAEPSQEIFERYQVVNYPGTVVYRRPSLPLRPLPAPLAPVTPAKRRAAPVAPAAPALDAEEAYALFGAGKAGEAINRLEELAAASPADYRAPYLLAKIFASRVRFAEAERWVDIALANRGLAPEAHYLRGIALQEQGKLESALAAFRRSVFLDQTFVLGHFAAAAVFGRTGQAARAQKSLATIADLLSGRPAEELLAEGDGLTVGRLRELVTVQRELVA
ncbi:MAG TPA: CheR family methyltransferase [Thermoleophilaceae bacterium]